MIDFEIPEETRLLVDTVRKFVETEVQPLEEEVDAEVRREIDRALERLGGEPDHHGSD